MKTYTLDGEKMSAKEIAEAAGVSLGTVYQRAHIHGTDLKRAYFTRFARSGIIGRITIDKVTYENVYEVAKAFKVGYNRLRPRLMKYGNVMTSAQLLGSFGQEVTVHGKKYASVIDAARALNISRGRIFAAIRTYKTRDLTSFELEQSYTRVHVSPAPKHVIQGVPYMSDAEAAAALGMKVGAFRKAARRGEL